MELRTAEGEEARILQDYLDFLVRRHSTKEALLPLFSRGPPRRGARRPPGPSGMYRRDFLALALGLAAVVGALREGPGGGGHHGFRKAWLWQWGGSDAGPGAGGGWAPGELPAPVSADLNGDGRPEVVVCEPVPGAGATRARLLVLSPALAGREGAGA